MSVLVSKKARLRDAQGHEAKLRGKIKRAHQAGKPRRVGHLARLYLQSYHARYVATVMANRSLKRHRRVPDERLPEIAANLDPWRGSTEEVVVYFKPKASNEHEFRPIMDFGIENRALQHLALAALRAQSDLHPNQLYTTGGTRAAISTVMAALAEGYNWVVETDIADCFPSFDGDRLHDLLPLPKGVTRQVIISSHLNIVLGGFLTEVGPDDGVNEWHDGPLAGPITEARRGIPQGSAASPLVSEMLLAPILTQLPNCVVVVAYADNILVMAREENDVESATLSLWGALKAHPAGPLRPNRPAIFRPGGNVEFLGNELRVVNGKCLARPSQENNRRFERTVSEGIQSLAQSSSKS